MEKRKTGEWEKKKKLRIRRHQCSWYSSRVADLNLKLKLLYCYQQRRSSILKSGMT